MHPHAAYVRGAKRRRTDSHRCGIERHPLRYGGANDATVPLFVNDFIAMVKGRGNHPSIVQIETFNEGDCWSVFKKASEKGAVMLSVQKGQQEGAVVLSGWVISWFRWVQKGQRKRGGDA